MKRLLYMLALVTLISCGEESTLGEASTQKVETVAVTKSPEGSPEPQQELRTIEDIQQEYAFIVSKREKGSMDSTSFGYNCNGEKKGTVTYFSEDGQLRMIEHVYNEYSHFSAADQYLVKEGALFFVFYDRLAWSFVGLEQTQDNITESRFYIVDDKLAKCL